MTFVEDLNVFAIVIQGGSQYSQAKCTRQRQEEQEWQL